MIQSSKAVGYCKGYNDTCTYPFPYHTLHQPEASKLTRGPKADIGCNCIHGMYATYKNLNFSHTFSSLILHTYRHWVCSPYLPVRLSLFAQSPFTLSFALIIVRPKPCSNLLLTLW